MQILHKAHLGYCTNIHPGESWAETLKNLDQYGLKVKQALSPDQPFGIGLRLSNEASLELIKPDQLEEFKAWLTQNNCYVFTLNGFPYGGFHQQVIKDQVHAPDWTTLARLDYTKRLATILAALLPAGMEGGISTSPLSYRWWHDEYAKVKETATRQLIELVAFLDQLKEETGRSIHIDIEPEPDGLLETGQEFLDYYKEYLLGQGVELLAKKLRIDRSQAADKVKEQIQLCLDVCHFAVEYENHDVILGQCDALGIKVGKIQISAAIKVKLEAPDQREQIRTELEKFVEPFYLHQAVMQEKEGALQRYRDLDKALEDLNNPSLTELRTHYHVPIFAESYGLLSSTQEEIKTVLQSWKTEAFTGHLEVETYTWQILPEGLKQELDLSIIREMQWVLNELQS